MSTLNEDLRTMAMTLEHHLGSECLVVDNELQVDFGMNSALVCEPVILAEGRTWMVSVCVWSPDHGLDEVVDLDGHTDSELPDFLLEWLRKQRKLDDELEAMLASMPEDI